MKLKSFIKPKNTTAAAGPSWQELLQQAVQLHQKGIEGDRSAVQQALSLFEQVRTVVPEDNLTLAYYGSALCLLGRDLEDNVQRSAKVIQGLKYLDQAVRNEPDQWVIRMLRGHVCVNLPETYFHQNAKAVSDFQYLITCYERYPEDIPKELYFQFLYNLCIAYHNLGQTEAAAAIRGKMQDEFKDSPWQSGATSKGVGNMPVVLQPLPILLETAEKIHQRALSGEKHNIQQALEFFSQARLLHPDQVVFEAYHADCLSLQGRNASNTGEMFANAIKATKTIDAAILKEPDNIQIRFIRAQQSMRLPEMFFARTATAVIDWEYLVERYRQEPQLFKKEQIEEIHYQLSLCYRRLGLNEEAEALWRELIADSSPEIQQRVARQLQINEAPKPLTGLSLVTQRTQFYEEAKRL
ncbi:MAG TPA: hypothetical protein VEC37_14275, partial [Bacillota bacterium]|nr:hypothetical protein [Bacillota bacterium]